MEIVKFLLENGANPNGSEEGIIPPPIILAVDYESKELFDILVNYNANVNSKD